MTEPKQDYSREQLELIKRTIAPDLDDNELAFFIETARHTGCDILAREIFCLRFRAGESRGRLVFVTGIDKYRSRAAESGEMDGHLGPQWCGPDGAWKDVWLEREPPAAARIGILRKGHREPYWGVARYLSYVRIDKDGSPLDLWRKMPDNQLAKCAEALALRKAFPRELGVLRTRDEMAQADNPPTPPRPLTTDEPPQVTARIMPTWDVMVHELSARIKKATKGGELNAIAADLERLRREGMPDTFYGALRDVFDQRAGGAKP